MVKEFDNIQEGKKQRSDTDMADKLARGCGCIAILALLIAIGALVISVLILVRPGVLQDVGDLTSGGSKDSDKDSVSDGGKGDSSTDDVEKSKQDRVYVIAYDVPWGERQFLSDAGNLRGLSVELVSAVCNEAGVTCRHVVAPISACWTSEGYGEGLLNGWFDACCSYYRTVTRSQIFSFSGEFYKAQEGAFFRKTSSSASVGTLASSTVAVLTGWAHDYKCMQRNGKTAQNSIEIDTYEAAATALNDGTVDLVFAEETLFDGVSGVEKIPGENLACLLGGAGAMHRIDSKIGEWFEPAYQNVRRTGKLEEICGKYSDDLGCIKE